MPTEAGDRRVPVVDASVVVDWVAPGADVRSPAMRLARRLADRGEELRAPRLLMEEVTNALLTGVRRGRWSGADADASYATLRRMPVRLADERDDLDRAYELSRRYDEHPVYDMLYVALAERLGEQLITADDRLRRTLVLLPFVVGVE